MIQRIQTVWLLLGMACGVALLYFPVWQAGPDTIVEGMDIINVSNPFFLLGVPPVLFITHAIAIFSFRKRKMQLRMCGINITLFLLFLLVALIFLQVENNILSNFSLADFKLGAILPIGGVIFNLMARGGIRKDEELIRSMDRLR